MEEEKKGLIIDEHLKVKTLDDIQNYMLSMLPNSFNAEVIERSDSNGIVCIDTNFGCFDIKFVPGDCFCLAITYYPETNQPTFVSTIKNLFASVMWQNEKGFRDPVLSYVEDGDTFCYEWYTPKSALRNIQKFAYDAFVYGEDYNDVCINYSGIKTADDLKDTVKFGKCMIFLPIKEQEVIDRTENKLVLAYYLDKYISHFSNLTRLDGIGLVREEVEIRTVLLHNIAYICQKLDKFNIDIMEPTFDAYVITDDVFAFLMSYHDQIEKLQIYCDVETGDFENRIPPSLKQGPAKEMNYYLKDIKQHFAKHKFSYLNRVWKDMGLGNDVELLKK